MADMSDFDLAILAQRNAANPATTRFSSANAGSGKTRVLVDRVSRILLQDTLPEKILCLTYTKAAASEMQSRLFATLGEWSVCSEEQLKSQLDELLGQNHGFTDLPKARRLFAGALETPEGLKVQTIHAFCERILARFPIEAGILPGFEPLDDSEMYHLKNTIRDDVYRAAASDSAGELNKALQLLAAEKADDGLGALWSWAAGSADKIRKWKDVGGVKYLGDILELNPKFTRDDIKIHAWEDTPKDLLSAAISGLAESENAKEQGYTQILNQAISEPDPVKAFDLYASVALKADMTPFSQIGTKASGPDTIALFGKWNKIDTPEMHRIADIGQALLKAQTLALTGAVFTLAQEYSQRFERAKSQQRSLDFNDQILLVRDLLKNKIVSDWIRYKLDGGIEHILLDEAQDTSPAQWDIIDALHDAFVQDNPDRPSRHSRTLFAVGDEKQSIYSFQGADPEMFLSKIRDYAGDNNVGEVRMRMSFRSAPEILSFVDHIFVENGQLQNMFDALSHPTASDIYRHTAHRTDGGRVDLWPLMEKPEKSEENPPWNTAPVDALTKGDAREQLAVNIAEQVKQWLDRGEPIFERDLSKKEKRPITRPMQAGDIMVLVRSRNKFFDAVIRNLKAKGVAVAGADRLKLKEAVVVKDMISLAKFVLLPSDNLSLAEVLKGPFFGYSEEDLFDVSYEREGSLWASIKLKRGNTAKILSDIMTISRNFAPYEFFARVLDMVDEAGESFARKLYGRLGMEAKDALEAFLARTLAHQRQGAPSLQQFVQAFSQDDQELKRQMDEGKGQVRVMTVHGAKGLEAPVVFLPDTTQFSKRKPDMIPLFTSVSENERAPKKLLKGFFLPQSQRLTPQALSRYIDAVETAKKQEDLRLLYVALTRAESRLVICGFQSGNAKDGMAETCWYRYALAAFEGLESHESDTVFGTARTYGQAAKSIGDIGEPSQKRGTTLPDWCFKTAPREGPQRRQVTPSHLLAPPPHRDMPVRSPLTQTSETRFMRGNLIHKLLEILPEFDVEKRAKIAEKILSGYKMLTQGQSDVIIAEVFAVLNAPEFAPIFAPGSRAEISLAGSAKGLPDHLYLNAQIDRISVTENKVFIVDYKSNRPPPKTQEGVADIYWGQMAAYRELAREIYPNHEIVCGLLWTDGPRLMILDDERLDMALTQIASLPT